MILIASYLVVLIAGQAGALGPVQPPGTLPGPTASPLAIDFRGDPVLGLARQQGDNMAFRDAVAAAVARNPATVESDALRREAREGLSQARAANYPSVDLNLSSYRVITRDFSNDPQNIIERSRPRQRTDALVSVRQSLIDFGGADGRIAAAGARLRAASADLEASADAVALDTIAAWYDVFGYRALVALSEAFIAGEREIRAGIQRSIQQGVSAEGDIARTDSEIARGEMRLARYRRQLANAEARFRAATGAPAPIRLERAPIPEGLTASLDGAASASLSLPAVRSAEANAVAARGDAAAARADQFPQISAGIDAGRYGVFENARDYDVRGTITLRQRLFGGIDARARQFSAAADAARARADRAREQAARDAQIAWADVVALTDQLEALGNAYRASRQSRDVIVARFRASRGTLFDVLAAEDAYFDSASSYIEGLTQLDAARYILLSRTGNLLPRLGIDPARLGSDYERR